MNVIFSAILTILIIIGIISGFLAFFYFTLPIIDADCLKDYAVGYCSKLNQTYRPAGLFDDFRCTSNNERKSIVEGYNYLKSEKTICTIKYANSWRKK